MQDRIVIASRESALAMWQACHIRDLLQAQYPQRTVEILGMTTRGDQILDKTLSKVGGKGLFVKELEAAMVEHRADLAVHSLKDVPMVLPPGFVLAAVTAREDPRDAFVSRRYESLEAMPAGAVVGTSSLRRELMIRSHYPSLRVKSVRGNVGTRLKKLDAGDYDALVMAGAGLKRLGFSERIRGLLPVELSLPSPGQGALAIEVLEEAQDLCKDLSFLNDVSVRAATAAERAVSRALGGSCQVPLAAYALPDQGDLWLRALVGDHRTGETLFAEARGPMSDPEALALRVIAELRAQGAEKLLLSLLDGD